MQKQFKAYNDEVLARINSLPTTVPMHRKAFKQGFSFSKEPFEKQLPIWNAIWKNAGSFWLRLHAFFFLEQHVTKKDLLPAIWQTSVSWQEDVDDWGLCDALAKLNTKALEALPTDVYGQLAAWNKDKDLWKRRQSVVSLLYFSHTKKTYLPFGKIAALVQPLLTDKEYYVEKGVGWALREMYTVYPRETMPFLQQHIKAISAIAFTIAIEKMGTEKEPLKAARKARQKNETRKPSAIKFIKYTFIYLVVKPLLCRCFPVVKKHCSKLFYIAITYFRPGYPKIHR